MLVLSGCIDFAEVTKFAALSQAANSSFPALVADIEDSCKRQATYSPDSVTKDKVLASCENLAKSRDGLLKAQQVLLNYMEALKNLSSDESISFDQKLDALPDALSKSGLDDKQVKATSGLAKALLDAAVNGYRRKELAKLVGQSDEDVAAVTTGLKKVIGSGYLIELQNEELAINTYYKDAEMGRGSEDAPREHVGTDAESKEARQEHDSLRKLTVLLVEKSRAQDLEAVQKKKDAAIAYSKIMDSIAEGHKKLFDSRKQWSTEEFLKLLGPEISDIYSSVQQVRKAFN
jgi:hypothetical protein